MLDACVQTIVRNGDDYLEPCISVVAPHVKRVRITIDNRTSDETVAVANRLRKKFKNVEVRHYHVTNPFEDIVAMRNSQLGFPEKWGFIVDSDEYHTDIARYKLGNALSYAFQSWAVWKPHFAHRASSRALVGRIFRNTPQVEWRGAFNNEVLYNGSTPVFADRRAFLESETVLMPYRYIHFTYVKKEDWRTQLARKRVADGRSLIRIPREVAEAIRRIHEEMSIVPKWRI